MITLVDLSNGRHSDLFRGKNNLFTSYRSVSEQICARLTINSAYVKEQLNKSEPRVMRVRHEDFSMNPVETVKAIYKFIGKPATQKLLRWVEAATVGKTTAASGGGSSLYSTKRNAKDVITAWRSWYGYDELKIVQEVCGQVLNLLNYTTFTSQLEMNDLNATSF